MQITFQNLFAVPVYAADLEGFQEHVPALIARIETLRGSGAGILASNHHAFHTARDFHLAEDSATAWMREAFVAFAVEALGSQVQADTAFTAKISAAWAIAADHGGYLVPHNHFPSPWAGVLHLDAEHTRGIGGPENVEGALSFLSPVNIPESFGLHTNMVVHPKDGRAVIFHGSLQHMVHPHHSEKTRYSVSFNFFMGAKDV